MTVPAAEHLLDLWERHHAAHPLRRALALLQAAWPQADVLAWAQAPVGTRDAWLLRLFEELFGPQLRTIADCPQCGERLESNFLTRDIRSREPGPPGPPHALHWQDAGCNVDYRLPSTEDLLAAAQSGADAPRLLLQRCIVQARKGRRAIAPDALPETAVAGIAEAMAQADPDADVRLNLRCPACGHGWRLAFDIVSYLWGELSDWARRTLAEVDRLARAYGWSERDILRLSPTRRQLYLELLRT
jgi:hypothetical protein